MNDNQNNGENSTPHINVNTQYIKDLSYESPNMPQVLAEKNPPKINLMLDVDVKKMGEDNTYEVALHIQAKANFEEKVIFLVELVYAGVFTLLNIPQKDHNPILGIQCTSMLFPYARKIVADMTQSGGFQPLMIDPIDFAALYAKKVSEMENKDQASQD